MLICPLSHRAWKAKGISVPNYRSVRYTGPLMGRRGEIFSKVRGVSYRQAATAWCHRGTVLRHEREPSNPHDPNAIALSVHGGLLVKRDHKLGYISRALAEQLAPMMDRGLEIQVTVLQVTGRKRRRRGRRRYRGVNILITFDRDAEREIEKQMARDKAIKRAREAKEALLIAELEAERALARKQRRDRVARAIFDSVRWCVLLCAQQVGRLLRYLFVSYMKLWKDPDAPSEQERAGGV